MKRIRFSPLSLLLVLSLVFMLSLSGLRAGETRGGRPQRFLLISDPSQGNSRKISSNLRRAMKDASVAFEERLVESLPGCAGDFGRFQGVILAAESVGNRLPATATIDFIERGGVVLFALGIFSPDLWTRTGIRPLVASEPRFITGTGFTSTRPVFGDEVLNMPERRFGASGFDIVASPGWEVELTYLQPATMPLLLSRSLGRGRIVFWNGDCLHLKEFRGQFLFSLLRAVPLGAMSIFNAILFDVDDSPPPAYGIREDPVERDFGFTDYQFYGKIWYDQVPELLREYGIRAAHYPCFSYSDQRCGTFAADIDRVDFFQETITTVSSIADEIGLHGFNHQSLTTASGPCPAWPSATCMVDSLAAAQILWERLGLKPPLTYVPPNNVIDAPGKQALTTVFPSIRGLCRLFVGGDDRSPGHLEEQTGDEFGPDPDEPRIMDIPRLSSGYILDQVNRFSVLNGVMCLGLIHHFIHPDDIYDSFRAEGKDWEYHLASLRRMVAAFRKFLPHARNFTPCEFILPLRSYLADTATITIEIDGLSIDASKGGRDHFFIFHRDVASKPEILGGTFLGNVATGTVWMIRIDGPGCRLRFPLPTATKSVDLSPLEATETPRR